MKGEHPQAAERFLKAEAERETLGFYTAIVSCFLGCFLPSPFCLLLFSLQLEFCNPLGLNLVANHKISKIMA